METSSRMKKLKYIQSLAARAMDEQQQKDWLNHINSRPRKKNAKRS